MISGTKENDLLLFMGAGDIKNIIPKKKQSIINYLQSIIDEII